MSSHGAVTQQRLPQQGEIVTVRQRRYLVDDVALPTGTSDSILVQLSCVDDDAQGQQLSVLWDLELDAEILTADAWDGIAQKGFDPPDHFGAYLNTLRWNCVTATDANLLQSPFRAGIRLDAYQLEPLRKALKLPRVNLFIADDVGLGKTIEAGLIARELLMRKKVREIVVACPPSMLLQWKEELEARFGLQFEILDKEYIQHVRRDRGFGVNPWTTHPRFLVSQRLLVDEAYSGPLMDWMTEFRPGTLLILDEAHHAAPSSGQRYAIDSHITRAIRDLAPRFEHRLFLSATPHNGHSNSFSALLELLDPQRFIRGVPPTPRNLEDVMVRRLKEDLREISGEFPRREVVQVDIDSLPADAPELCLAELLDEYRRLREQRLSAESSRTQAASGLLICGLQQRLLSSIEAFSRTLRVHRRTVQKHWDAAQQESAQGAAKAVSSQARFDLLINSVTADDDRASLSEEDLAREEEQEIEAVSAVAVGSSRSQTALELFQKEQKLLDQMTELAEASRALPDARVEKLLGWMRRNLCPDLGKPRARWQNTRVIIFTEYDDTRRYLQQQLNAAIAESDRASERIAIFYGPTPAKEREEIKLAFNADPAENPVRILIATDAAREGLNLQGYCFNLFHFDVPWNPSRMEQRNGRIDRKLQLSPIVYCHYFFYKQREEDKVLQALVRKTKTIREELGSLAQVIDSRLDKLMKGGIRRSQVVLLTHEIETADLEGGQKETVQEELEATRERQVALKEQIEKLRTLLEKSRNHLQFKEEHFRLAISCGLQILGAEPLKMSREKDGSDPARFTFPALDQRRDPTWAETMDTLRAPRKREEKFWEWRNNSRIRPVVFDDPGKVTDEVVQLHLEQRVVQRLLSRFSAQGFVQHDLSRACLAQSSDSVARVLLIGRLALYGPSAARLHEELVPITARWIDPQIRKGELSPYGREAQDRTLALLDSALLERSGRQIPEVTVKQLQQSAGRDVSELLPHLTVRAKEYAQDAVAQLEKRAEEEAAQMARILEDQRKHLEKSITKYDREQQFHLFPEEERRQAESNRKYWDKRLAALQQELKTEPERIRSLYKVQAQRIEPVGLVYLWPITR
jgi:ERCC4-related helicase